MWSQRAWISAASVPGSARPACLNQRGQRAWISAASVPGSARPVCLDPVGRSVVSACASDTTALNLTRTPSGQVHVQQCIVDSRGIKLQNLMSICVGGQHIYPLSSGCSWTIAFARLCLYYRFIQVMLTFRYIFRRI